MKFLITLFISFLFSSIMYSQGQEGEAFPDNELNIQVQNAPNRTITFEFIPVGANWANSSGCNFLSYNDETTYISTIDVGEEGYVDCRFNGYEYRYYNEGNYTDIFSCADDGAGLKPMRNGFYRINIKDNGQLITHVYFDWRDTGFPVSNNCSSCTGNDMTIRYDGDDEQILFWNDGGINHDNLIPDEYLTSGQIITWAEFKCGLQSTTNLENFWANALVILTDQNNPRIVWGPHPTFQATSYKVYRAVSATPLAHPELYANVIATVSNNTFEYKDIDIASGPDYIYYFVKGYNGSYSNRTNIEQVNGGFYKENLSGDGRQIFTFDLEQNYPNPFNPSTTISFSVEENSFIKLKVYDVLGNEIAELVNEAKEPGSYSVLFGASNLSSGIYFYILQANNKSITRKLLFTK